MTDASGFYTFPNLPAGRYNISAELQGFKKSVKKASSSTRPASVTMDFALSAGAISENVTVTAEQTLLQTDVALRKTVESKDIEQLSFSGRNPIGVAGLKPGVIGGSFNNYGFSRPRQRRLQHQRQPRRREQHHRRRRDRHPHAFDRRDHRHPERRRHPGSAGPDRRLHARVRARQRRQIRFVTKSGSNRYSGSGSYFLRDDKLQANTWTRNKSTNRSRTAVPAPFDYKQYAYSVGGPIPSGGSRTSCSSSPRRSGSTSSRSQTNTATVPTEKMRAGDFSELLNRQQRVLHGARRHHRSTTGQPFPGNIIRPAGCQPNGVAILKRIRCPRRVSGRAPPT